jgi:D-serine deaminase-like pyridoxal phosphate-dependent protein
MASVHSLDTLPTPALVLNAAAVRRNVDRLARYAAKHNIRVRPHTKTHKSQRLAQLQLDAGASGLTVAKYGEAEVMAQVCDDLLLAYPALDPWRTQQLASLAQRVTLRVAVDSAEAIERLSAAARQAGSVIGLLVDLDVGMGRTGVASSQAAVALAQQIERTPGTRLDGLFCYPGQIWDAADQQQAALAPIAARLQEALDRWSQHGLCTAIVSGGSTPTAFQSHLIPQLTEIRPGTYIFNDMNTVRGGYCSFDDCAARIVCTVISNAVPGQVVLDGGSKTFSSDLCAPARDSGHGYLVEYPTAKITKLSEEHGQVDVTSCESLPRLGERVTVIPNHICPCVNLQDTIWWVEEGAAPERLTVDARGKIV